MLWRGAGAARREERAQQAQRRQCARQQRAARSLPLTDIFT